MVDAHGRGRPGRPVLRRHPQVRRGHAGVQRGPGTLETRIDGFDAAAIQSLKDSTDGVVYVSGSGQLVRAMLQAGLVDELHLFVYPVAVGAGKRLWADDADTTTLTLTEHDFYDNGVVHLAHGPA